MRRIKLPWIYKRVTCWVPGWRVTGGGGATTPAASNFFSARENWINFLSLADWSSLGRCSCCAGYSGTVTHFFWSQIIIMMIMIIRTCRNIELFTTKNPQNPHKTQTNRQSAELNTIAYFIVTEITQQVSELIKVIFQSFWKQKTRSKVVKEENLKT